MGKRNAPKGRWVDDDRAIVSCPFKKPGSWAAGWHTGVDLAVPGGSGQRIVWANKNAGTVITNSWDKSYGNYVVVRGAKGHDWWFCHMASKSALKVGAKVRNGDLIGKVGSTGNITGPHLHLEKRPRGGGYANVLKPTIWKGYK